MTHNIYYIIYNVMLAWFTSTENFKFATGLANSQAENKPSIILLLVLPRNAILLIKFIFWILYF